MGKPSGEGETCDVEFYYCIYNHLITCSATDMNQKNRQRRTVMSV